MGGSSITGTPIIFRKNRIELVKGDANGKIYDKLYPLQIGYGKRGESGIEVSDWLPHLSALAAPEAAVRR